MSKKPRRTLTDGDHEEIWNAALAIHTHDSTGYEGFVDCVRVAKEALLVLYDDDEEGDVGTNPSSEPLGE